MTLRKKSCIVLLGILGLLLATQLSCTQPGFTTYTNDEQGYKISYPANWEAEVSTDSAVYIIKSPSHLASARIDVISPISAQQAAQHWIMAMGTGNSDFTLVDNKSMEGFWDWYASYDFDSGTGYGPYHGEAYFKSTAQHIYKLDTVGDSKNYTSYPFPAIISSFNLK